MEKAEKILLEKIEELLELLDQKDAKVEIKEDKENQIFLVKIESSSPGPLIGRQGRNLSSLQYLLNLIFWRKTEGKGRVIIDINNYRDEQKERLIKMAQDAALKVKAIKQSVSLPPMSSFERRIIHLSLADDQEIETVSQDEGPQRHIVVQPKV